MASKKTETAEVKDEIPAQPRADVLVGDGTGEALPALPEPAYASDAKATSPIHTQERDPADRLAWKRERARQLGHHRD